MFEIGMNCNKQWAEEIRNSPFSETECKEIEKDDIILIDMFLEQLEKCQKSEKKSFKCKSYLN